MTFSFTNYAGIAPRHAPLSDIIGKVLGGYTDVTKAKYMKPQIEADIFHKQISPLAMLASSPYFSSLHPQQQQQIAGYISQMLDKQGLGSEREQGGMRMGGNPMGQQGYGQHGEMGYQGQSESQMGSQEKIYNEGDNDNLIPENAGEHFTGKFTESPYSGGTAHRGSQGETIYAPTGSNVQKGLDVLTESKGLKNLFENYSKIAPDIGGAGGFKRDLSNVASGIQKTRLPYTQKISELLGGPKLSNEAANAQAMQAEMAPALRAIGFSNAEINSMLQFYPGETARNIKERLKYTWPIIEQKIASHQKNLNKGINVNNNVIGENELPRSLEQKIARDNKERTQAEKVLYKDAPPGSIGLYRKGKLYYIPQNEVDEALKAKFTYE